jgi:NAD(P)-dependent dehydrogenase (short-subunit alcohol dehydrogenase family)
MNKANICTFNDRVALVTGAGGNIGSATVARLVAHGVRVAAVDITAELVDARLSNFNIDKAMYKGYGVDVVNRDGVFKLVDEVIADFGKIDIVVNNAGIWEHRDVVGRQRFEEMPYAEWKRLLDIDIDGVFHFCQAILPHMIERGYGRIVNLTSIAGECGLPGYADYSTAKAGIITLTKTLAMENAKKGITVNCVSPGMVAVGEPVPEPGTWIGRKGGADEMARGIVFLAADESSFITGVDLPVEGGRALGPHNCDM